MVGKRDPGSLAVCATVLSLSLGVACGGQTSSTGTNREGLGGTGGNDDSSEFVEPEGQQGEEGTGGASTSHAGGGGGSELGGAAQGGALPSPGGIGGVGASGGEAGGVAGSPWSGIAGSPSVGGAPGAGGSDGVAGQPGDCACGLPHAEATCVQGGCQIVVCDAGYGDCNGDPNDGCEVAHETDPHNCGACGMFCDINGYEPVCMGGMCVGGLCPAGHADCNAVLADGCETFTENDSSNCGSCGNVCAQGLALCISGACIYL